MVQQLSHGTQPEMQMLVEVVAVGQVNKHKSWGSKHANNLGIRMMIDQTWKNPDNQPNLEKA